LNAEGFGLFAELGFCALGAAAEQGELAGYGHNGLLVVIELASLESLCKHIMHICSLCGNRTKL